MTDAELVHLEVDNLIATITLDSPHNRNALSQQLLAELDGHLRAAADDATVRGIVLTGTGNTFCAGADLSGATAPGVPIRAVRRDPRAALALPEDCDRAAQRTRPRRRHGPASRPPTSSSHRRRRRSRSARCASASRRRSSPSSVNAACRASGEPLHAHGGGLRRAGRGRRGSGHDRGGARRARRGDRSGRRRRAVDRAQRRGRDSSPARRPAGDGALATDSATRRRSPPRCSTRPRRPRASPPSARSALPKWAPRLRVLR